MYMANHGPQLWIQFLFSMSLDPFQQQPPTGFQKRPRPNCVAYPQPGFLPLWDILSEGRANNLDSLSSKSSVTGLGHTLPRPLLGLIQEGSTVCVRETRDS
ncbi:unnamed protein product [Rangifer tarandus platyrhynchus]|uniref:Uncharacterized protein n=1 Tax=Rangifer tarandus platyrhynchus TaxID=3082113 RepID=A0AC59YE65_RANTA